MNGKLDRILVYVRIEPENSPEQTNDLLYVSGTVEVLVNDCILVVGSFPGALLLLPSIDDIAGAMRKLRAGHKTVEVILVGDTGSLWMIERRSSAGISFAYRSFETEPVARDEIDHAFEQATTTFLETLIASRPISTWSKEALQIFDNIVLTWPNVARLKPRHSR